MFMCLSQLQLINNHLNKYFDSKNKKVAWVYTLYGYILGYVTQLCATYLL